VRHHGGVDAAPASPSAPAGLAARLKSATRELHGRAERAGVMADLLQGRIGRPGYGALLCSLHALYEALEAALDAHADSPFVEPLRHGELRRTPAIESDLAALFGERWRGDLAPAPAAAAYAGRLRRIAATGGAEVPLLAAHAYVRYLGDLHGGQILARTLRARFDLAGDAGLQFYAFGPAARVARLRQGLRAALDALPLTPACADAVADEARDAFARHVLLFEQLAAAGAT
jgi:heme oxygenase